MSNVNPSASTPSATAERTPSLGKIRSPGAIIGLNLLTLGVYSVYWWYAVNKELRDFGNSRDVSALSVRPVLSTLAFTFGGCLIIPYVWTAITTNQRIEAARRVGGVASGHPPWIAPFLLSAGVVAANLAGMTTGAAPIALLASGMAFAVGAYAYMQIALNGLWRSEGAVPKPRRQPPRPATGTSDHAWGAARLI